jgi:asparagine synthase (glutamine-hydrolysing)
LNQKGITGDRIYKLLEHFSAKNSWDFYHRLTRQWQMDESLILNPSSQNKDHWGSQDLFFKWKIEPWFQGLSLVEKMMLIDTLNYMVDDVLVKVDRATMYSALESRAPFLDHQVVEWAWSLPISYKVHEGQKKIILRKLLNQYVPSSLFERPKVGFSIPLEHWLRNHLKDWASNLLSSSSFQRTGLNEWVNTSLIEKKWSEHLSGKKNNQYALWNVLMLQQWLLQEKDSQ